jgi:multicomponent K+:H+ antiporter subunit C
MLLLLALFIGTLAGAGVWLLLRPRTFDVVLGLTLISYAVNLFIFAMGRVIVGAAPIVQKGTVATLANTADPLPQALVLTAIVISFAMTAVLLAIALVARAETGRDHVDGDAPHAGPDPRPDAEGGHA